jgi:peptidyl-prolyl cis-trans isomerase A (cyclophilin A)
MPTTNRRFACVLAFAAVLLTGCAQKSPEASQEAAPGPAASQAPSPAPSMDIYKVRFETTKGDFVVEVNPAWSPLGAQRFRSLVESGFYDQAKFFRVVTGFVVQFGMPADPNHPQANVEPLLDEPPVTSNKKGTLTFAKQSMPNTRTTQVFINLADNPRLDNMGFAPFGVILEGLSVVENLYAGYGEGPNQGAIKAMGNKYLDEQFPMLDGVKKATILPAK